jgi:hypothetical protein
MLSPPMRFFRSSGNGLGGVASNIGLSFASSHRNALNSFPNGLLV